MNYELFRIAITALALCPVFIIIGIMETMMSDSGLFFGLASLSFAVALITGFIMAAQLVLGMWV